ncbi:MAG TPA: hypothetical protein VGT40_11460 [Methylomirabilota bacterium]|jgi:hypothetical protein|nr:hypothetical protein [Methylomirabilota bacterium]
MDAQSTIADAVRMASQAYSESLSAVMKTLQGLPHQGGDAYRRMVEDWLGLARTSKDSFIAAVNQSFDLWERECRRAVGAPHAAMGAATPGSNPMEAWLQNWRRSVEAFASAGQPGAVYGEAARRQAELVQQTLQEGMRAWQRLWQPPDRP